MRLTPGTPGDFGSNVLYLIKKTEVLIMNNYIRNIDARINFITSLNTKQAIHVRNIVTNKIRDFRGDMYEVDLRLAHMPRRLGYQYITEVDFSACGLNFTLDFVID